MPRGSLLSLDGRRLGRLLELLLLGLVAACAPAPTPSGPSSTQSPTGSPTVGPTVVAPPATAPIDGELEWELIADVARDSDAGTISVHTTNDAFREWWFVRYPERVVPETRIDDAVFVAYNISVPGGCPGATIEGVVLSVPETLVFGEFNRDAEGRLSCGDRAGGHLFVVAIRRRDLPRGSVTFRLEREFNVCADCGRELEQVEVDL